MPKIIRKLVKMNEKINNSLSDDEIELRKIINHIEIDNSFVD